MRYFLFAFLLISCSHRIAKPNVIFESQIKAAKGWQKISGTVVVKIPLVVDYGWRNDTVRLAPGYGTKGYVYKVAVINDTLRIVDSMKIK